LYDEPIDERVEEVRLAREVMVETHRLDAQHGAELSHAEFGKPVLLDELERGELDAFAIELTLRRPLARAR
jgi:hypothetical protein